MDDHRTLPDGLGDEHFESGGSHASALSIIILGAILVAALSGYLGGSFNDRLTSEDARAAISYVGPTVIRNGMFFEAHAIATANEPIAKPVIAVSESLMHDITMNSMVPAAGEESFEDGSFRFTYDRLEKGDRLDVKFDFQINPSLMAGTEGKIRIYDDKDLLAEVPVTIAVLP